MTTSTLPRTRRNPSTALTAASPRAELTAAVGIGAQRFIPVVYVVSLEIVVAVGGMAAAYLGAPIWQGGIAGLAVGLLFVTPVRGSTLQRTLARRWGFIRDRRRRAVRPRSADSFDVSAPDGLQIGFRWDGTTLVSLLKIDANPQAMTVMEPGTTVSGEMVPVLDLIDCLHQFDIVLDSIDIISQGARSIGRTEIAAIYDGVLGPFPAIAHRTVWVAVRLDPSRCTEAVRRRGGGRDGILRTATTATQRVANRLTEAGLRPRILSASEIAATTTQLTDGASLATVEETWQTCHAGQLRLRSFAVQPHMLTTAGLGLLWTVPSNSTTVCVSLREDAEHGLVNIRGLARFDSDLALPDELRGLTHLRGLQFSALASSLPISPPTRPVGHWVYGPRNAERWEVAVPASGCGQVIGADEQGRAVALPLFGPRIRRVEICGTLHLVQQAVLRSLALGARVLVHSKRPAMWRDMVELVGRQQILWVAEFSRHAIQAGSDRNYTVEVFDRVAEQSVRTGITIMVVSQPNAPVTPDADVTLEAVSLEHDTVRVSTRAGSAIVTMVATSEEMRYLNASANCVD